MKLWGGKLSDKNDSYTADDCLPVLTAYTVGLRVLSIIVLLSVVA